MKFVTITGGLGNQIFIYSFCESLRARGEKVALFVPHRTNSQAYGHQGYELEKLFPIKTGNGFFAKFIVGLLSIYSHLLRFFPTKLRPALYRMIGIHVVTVDENFIFYPKVFSDKHRHELFRGTWQSELYFQEAKDKVRQTLVFRKELLSEETKKITKEMNTVQSVSIHIRRGDYLSYQYANGFAGVCTPDYYLRAIEYIKGKMDSPQFYIFTDDKEWVNVNFPLENATYVVHNTGKDSWQDMYLMSQCHYNIIANSSFSWWGAWLNANLDKIVIAPKIWWRLFENDDVVPEEWIRL
jgi:hypothetical protein